MGSPERNSARSANQIPGTRWTKQLGYVERLGGLRGSNYAADNEIGETAMMDLKGQVAIVTGSATGLGAAVALKLGERGAKVVINYTKSIKEAEATAAEAKAKDIEAILAQGDVGSDA